MKKTYLNLLGVTLCAASSFADAAPNPASQDWVISYVQQVQNNLQNYIQIFVQNYVANDLQNRTSLISYSGSTTQCTLGTDCPTSSNFQTILFQTQGPTSGALAPTYNTTTGEFTIHTSGIYTIQYTLTSVLPPGAPTDQAIVIYELFKGTTPISVSGSTFSATSFLVNISGLTTAQLQAGDTISLGYSIPQYEPSMTGTFTVDGASSSPMMVPPTLNFSINRIA